MAHSKLMSFGRHRDKVSTIAAIVVTPGGRRVRLFWHTEAEHWVDAAGVVAFLRKLLARLRGRVIVVWDGGSNPKGPQMRGLLAITSVCTWSDCRRMPPTSTRWS